MKYSLRILSMMLVLGPTFAWAQKVGVQVDHIDATENTTIEIKKGDHHKTEKQFEVIEGTEQIEGDAAPLIQDARKNWKTACAESKKEFKELNKDSQILSLSCGSMTCSTVAMESTCKSVGHHKLRVQVK